MSGLMKGVKSTLNGIFGTKNADKEVVPPNTTTLVKTRSRPEDRNLERVTSQYAVERNAVNQAAKEHLANKA